MLYLKEQPTLVDFQNYVKKLEIERGFSTQSARDKCLLLGEEVGELFKAIRKTEGLNIDNVSKIANIDDEIADILIYSCALANRFDVDLEDAFRTKEEVNKKRKWTSN